MMKFFKFGCLGIVGLIALGVVIGALSDGNNSTTTISSSSESKSSEEAKAQVYSVGQEVKIGKFSYIVNNVSETDKIEADYLEPLTSASGKFVVVDVTFKNLDKEARTLDTELFKLIDDKGTEYSASTDADMYLNGDNMFFLEQVNPNATRTGKVAFEVPKDANSYKLQVSSGLGFTGGEYAEIKLK
jgi:hypothetical protein